MIAHAIVEDMRRHDGDLARCSREWRTTRNAPLWGAIAVPRVEQSAAGGGVMFEMLNILDHFPLAALEHNSAEYVRVVAEAMKRATIDKDRHVGDPRFVEVPIERLIGKPYAAEMAAEIRAGKKADVPRFNAGAPIKDTTHVSVVDAEGNCVSMTHSLGMPSGVVTPGLGFMYNGCMGVFDPRPGRAGSLAPGKARLAAVRPLSSRAIGSTR
jgi:gamma-glutamyltranspeptidase/glutathione hydrolase